MNNEQIITEEAVNIWGRDKVEQFKSRSETIPLHTVAGWKSRGYKVKQGEHGIETKLWRKKNNADKLGKNQREFYLAKAYLFSIEQVEVID